MTCKMVLVVQLSVCKPKAISRDCIIMIRDCAILARDSAIINIMGV